MVHYIDRPIHLNVLLVTYSISYGLSMESNRLKFPSKRLR